MTKRASIAICDSSRLFREGVSSLLRAARFKILASVADIEELLEIGTEAGSDCIFLIGEHAGGAYTIETIARLKVTYPGCHVVMLVNSCSEEKRWQAERAGIEGVLLRSISSEALFRSLELVLMGERVFVVTADLDHGADEVASPGAQRLEAPKLVSDDRFEIVSGRMRDGKDFAGAGEAAQEPVQLKVVSTRREGLSDRELEILDCLISGHSNKVIARRCDITEATVKVHLKAILRKINVANRTQAAVWALNRMRLDEMSARPVNVAGDWNPDLVARSPGTSHPCDTDASAASGEAEDDGTSSRPNGVVRPLPGRAEAGMMGPPRAPTHEPATARPM
ncbi:response regulator transcription factor [Aurantimonas sp. Leaf443]|uniref:LuxR C-terminal-related transcriptional regulator n=1 Tax=Aurantimonas sp. Leaf443 TaxID=1736378 RepID=UPI000A992671|nr:response regulator transcription factor [Aurantimonas sp. Leaf443]